MVQVSLWVSEINYAMFPLWIAGMYMYMLKSVSLCVCPCACVCVHVCACVCVCVCLGRSFDCALKCSREDEGKEHLQSAQCEKIELVKDV